MGAIPIDLKLNIKKRGFDENETVKMTKMIQQKSISFLDDTLFSFV